MVLGTPTTIDNRSEEHTSELQSRLVISYAVFCLKNKKPPPLNALSRDDHEEANPTCLSAWDRALDSAAVGPARRHVRVFFKHTATTEIYTTRHTLSLHDALPISGVGNLLFFVFINVRPLWGIAVRLRNG